MAGYIRYTSKHILEEDFEIEYKGYKCEEVDNFLDGIAEDYKLFEDKLKVLQKENERLNAELKATNEKLSVVESAITEKDEKVRELSSSSGPYVKLHERLSEVEKKTFKK
ncbi:DivIVA domain-containing protein [Spiroplasma clarkii]|uniref:DivIVA domain-containing protein n=1 Tax=Spiroplasma clarkii TaxID=2139 RepID=A0A1Y0L211_9MOLU|nr:DivIVA domain-containing protein [Spiroplasma clarkii]ARU92013.1 DivIVA domain-containing protein [Spiroplasma clarkii]ATX71347.1 hypothetical protein SCLAR_v1c10470 [Spiroplasma clarkii]